MFNAGRVGFTPKGDYDSTKTYSMLNVVSHQGSSYFAKGDVPVNTAPPNTTYWQLSAYGGSAANLAGNFAPLETTDYASQGYEIGDFLVNKNNQFCKATSIITLGDQIIVKPNAGYNVETTDAGKEVNRIDLRIDQLTASQIGYDGTTSGLSATDAQAAIDEVVSDLGTLDSQVSAHDTALAKTYKTDDTTENTLASDDVLPFYDTSATAQRKMSVEKFVGQTVSNPNLLDNPWFTVNQRGFTSESGINKYTVDRWYTILSANVTVNADKSITITGTGDIGSCICQKLPSELTDGLLGREVTFSALLSDGTIYKSTDTLPLVTPGTDTQYCGLDDVITNSFASGFYWSQNLNSFVAQIGQTTGHNCTIKAIKLELGSVSTLAMDTTPDYATELAKCQRYFIRYASKGDYSGLAPTYYSNGKFYGEMFLPCAMRQSPSATITGTARAYVYSNPVIKQLTTIAIQYYYTNGNIMKFNVTPSDTTDLTNGDFAEFQVTNGAYLDLSADL